MMSQLQATASLALLLLAAFAPLGTTAGSSDASTEKTVILDDFYAKLVSAPSKLARQIKKVGMIPTERWEETQFSFEPFNQWVLNSSVYRRPVTRNYPMSFPCGVWVNHKYKFMFIRNRKAASTTVIDNFDKCHYKNADPNFCVEEASLASFQKAGISPEAAWKEYFVFSTARNPFSRAGSSYDYCSTKWLVQTGPCSQPAFRSYCHDPSILGKIANLFHCYDHVGMYHDYYHTEPVAPCLTTHDGQPAVDFLIRYENLTEDYLEAVRLLNERRDPKLAPIPEPKVRWKKKGQAADAKIDTGVERATAALVGHGDKYRQCGMACVNDVASYFAQDLKLFQIELPPLDGAGAAGGGGGGGGDGGSSSDERRQRAALAHRRALREQRQQQEQEREQEWLMQGQGRQGVVPVHVYYPALQQLR